MNKLLAYTSFVFFSLFSIASFATESSSPATKDVAKVPETPKGIIAHKLISEAPLPTDFVMGDKNAKVVIVEYASLSCPHCAHFSTTILPDLQKKYIDTGKVKYVLRQFPLNEPAFNAAVLVNCIGKEDSEKYYLFSKVLFDSQSKWAFDGNWQQALETISAVGGVNKEKFDSCIKNKEIEEATLNAKKAAMEELHVPHTPYFFIGGEAYNNDKTFEEMSKFIDGKLAGK